MGSLAEGIRVYFAGLQVLAGLCVARAIEANPWTAASGPELAQCHSQLASEPIVIQGTELRRTLSRMPFHGASMSAALASGSLGSNTSRTAPLTSARCR